jgi:hypothetical protein
MIRRIVQVAAALLAGALLCAGTASAAPAPAVAHTAPAAILGATHLTIGPVPIPALSLRVCVNGACRTVPKVTAVTIDLRGAATLLPTAPVILPVACSSGLGLGVRTLPGTLGAVTGTLTIKATGAGTVTIPLSQSVGVTKGLSVSACTV